MVRAWYMDETDADQREPHMPSPTQFVTVAELKNFGVNYWQLDTSDLENNEKLENIRKEFSYDYGDEIECTKDKLPDYDNTLKKFFTEHIHPDDEVRLVVEGSGYFDIRDPHSDHWIRIEVVKDDMISIPPGIYHRFTLNTKNFIKAKRYFSGTARWTPLNRPQDNHPARISYLAKYGEVTAS